MSAKKRIVVVGGVAAGPKVASRVARLIPNAEVTIVEKGSFLSYAGCGLPYYVSGVVKEQKELMCTPVGVVRDPAFFQSAKNVRVLSRTKAMMIDRKGQRVRVQDTNGKADKWLSYDYLALCTGAVPLSPPIPGIEKSGVLKLQSVEDGEELKKTVQQKSIKNVVIVGGGLIGIETTEALSACGCQVTIVEALDQILSMLDWEMAKLVHIHMESKGIRIMAGRKVVAIEGQESVQSVVLDNKEVLPADCVVFAIGVRPNTELAKEAGLKIGSTGGIVVDEQMRTSDPLILAAGDCVENRDIMTGTPCFVPLGSTANKQGRVAANTIAGREDRFPGILGATVCQVFDFCVARTGLTEKKARANGLNVEIVLSPSPDRAHFMPQAKPLLLKLIVDRKSRVLVGAQSVGPGVGDKRIDVSTMAIMQKMTVDSLAQMDLAYAPPYAPAMDNLIVAANIARNKLDGLMSGISPMELSQRLKGGENITLLDVRTPGEYEEGCLANALFIPLGSLRHRMHEVPKDKPIVAFCKISLRGYEAARILQAEGYDDVKVLDGGLAMWPYEKAEFKSRS